MNPIGMNLSSNVDPTAAAMNADYQHNQRMADVMRMQALQPIQNVGASPLSRLSPFQALANILQAHVANKYSDKAHEVQSDMLKAMQAHTEQGLQQYMQDYQNDPRGAVMNAMKSQSPVVRAMATQELKGLMTPKTMANHATDASVIASGGNVQGFAAKDNLKPIQPGSLLMDEQGQLRTPTTQPGANAELVNINGNLMHKTPTGLDPVLKAPNISITNNPTLMNAGQKAGMTEGFSNAGKKIDAMGVQAGGSQQLIHTLDQLETLDKDGIYSNRTAPAATFLSNIAQATGVKLPESTLTKLGNTEAYNASAIDTWQKMIAQMDGNKFVTEKESALIMKSLPLAEHSPEARKIITGVLRNAAMRNIQNYQHANTKFYEALQNEDISKLAPLMQEIYTPSNQPTNVVPGVSQQQPTRDKVPTFQELLMKKGIIK